MSSDCILYGKQHCNSHVFFCPTKYLYFGIDEDIYFCLELPRCFYAFE